MKLVALLTEPAIGLDGQTLATPEAKRAAVLDFWATRTDSAEGDAIREVVSAWLEATVQTSATPVTAAERRAAEARAGERLS